MPGRAGGRAHGLNGARCAVAERHLRLDLPIALLLGEHDMESFRRSAHLIKKAAKRDGCTYALMRGHVPLLEVPDVVAEWVREQLSEIPDGSTNGTISSRPNNDQAVRERWDANDGLPMLP